MKGALGMERITVSLKRLRGEGLGKGVGSSFTGDPGSYEGRLISNAHSEMSRKRPCI